MKTYKSVKWKYRIKEITKRNGIVEYRVVFRINIFMLWSNYGKPHTSIKGAEESILKAIEEERYEYNRKIVKEKFI